MGNIQGKVWGSTGPLFFKNNVEIHRIEVVKGGFCSKHKHEHNTLLAICKKCGSTEELFKEMFEPIFKMKKFKKFDLSFFDLEILTKCRSCQ